MTNKVSNKNYYLSPLEWDTEYFGVNSSKVNLYDDVNDADQERIIRFCENFEFVTIYNNKNSYSNNRWLGQKTNAFLTDVNIQFVKRPSRKPNCQAENTYVENNLPFNSEIINIAKKSFHYSRFFNDPKLPVIKTKNIYLHWTKNAFGHSNKYFVISERDGVIAGFILFSFTEDSCVIELIAVDEKYQGQKVGSSLMHALESFVFDSKVNIIKVGTQLNNITAIEFYTSRGFKYSNCISVYHLWI